MKRKLLNNRRERRVIRTRSKLLGTSARPRLAVFRSNTALYAQLIDDSAHKTIVSASTREVSGKENKSLKAAKAGEAFAKKAVEKGIKEAVFDRRGYAYHGRVKSFADGARKGGLKF